MTGNQLAVLEAALEALERAGFVIGPQWQAVHDICQANEGRFPYDGAHALCHRIEGDSWNAAYWYRRAGKSVHTGSFADEYEELKSDLAEGD